MTGNNTIGRLTRLTLHKALSPVLTNSTQRGLVVSSAVTGFKGVILYWGLTIVGLDPSPLLAVFGMFGAAVGFAAKDLVSNFMGGAVIAAESTFKKGDKIAIGTSGLGTLIDMDMRYLYLEKEDGTLLMIPNSAASTSVVMIADGAKRKRAEVEAYEKAAMTSSVFGSSSSIFSVSTLTSTPDGTPLDKAAIENRIRREKFRIFFTFALFLPSLALATLSAFIMMGFITSDDIDRWMGIGKGSIKYENSRKIDDNTCNVVSSVIVHRKTVASILKEQTEKCKSAVASPLKKLADSFQIEKIY